MLQSVEAVYRDGKIELRERGIDEAQATDLRARLATFAQDWNRPEMDVYDQAKA